MLFYVGSARKKPNGTTLDKFPVGQSLCPSSMAVLPSLVLKGTGIAPCVHSMGLFWDNLCLSPVTQNIFLWRKGASVQSVHNLPCSSISHGCSCPQCLQLPALTFDLEHLFCCFAMINWPGHITLLPALLPGWSCRKSVQEGFYNTWRGFSKTSRWTLIAVWVVDTR